MPAPNAYTELVIIGLAAPYATRGLTQTLEPIDQAANMRRTINGALIDVSSSRFRKYRSTISCADHRAPALDGVWPGMSLTVDCAAYLAYPEGGTPERTAVVGSETTEQGFTYYRPRLTMRVTRYSTSLDEYGAVTSWTLELEEV